MFSKPPLQELNDSLFAEKNVHVSVLRLDLIHPEVNGNKWYKLKYNLEEAKKNNYTRLLTFGGAWSNHLPATSAAGKILGFNTIGIVRGEELNTQSNASLKRCADNGMHLHFISREAYHKKEEPAFIEQLKKQFGEFYLIPEGGSNELAVHGAAEIVNEINVPFDFICTACGTGGTLAGIASALNEKQKVIGFAALNAVNYFDNQIKKLLNRKHLPDTVELIHNYHFGGYAKTSTELKTFSEHFFQKFNIQPDPVYNSKMYYGIFDLISKGFFEAGSAIICLHTGGNL